MENLHSYDLNSYEAKVIGIEKYKELARRCNLLTKKWTYGRVKMFHESVKYEMKIRKKLFGKKYKRNKGL